MIDDYLKQIVEDSVRKVIREELQKAPQLKTQQTDQEVLEALRAKRTTHESDWEGSYLSREEWEEIAVRYLRENKINYEVGRKAADIANDGGIVQEFVDEIERYRKEYGITQTFLGKSPVSKFRTVVSLYVDEWGIPLDTLYDVPIHQLYDLHKKYGIVNNKRDAQRVIKLFKSGKTGKEIIEGD